EAFEEGRVVPVREFRAEPLRQFVDGGAQEAGAVPAAARHAEERRDEAGAEGRLGAGVAAAGPDAEAVLDGGGGLLRGEFEELREAQPPAVQLAVAREGVAPQRVAAELVLLDEAGARDGVGRVHERSPAAGDDVLDGPAVLG